jgi:formate dehydrogenase maturation protein FdhE
VIWLWLRAIIQAVRKLLAFPPAQLPQVDMTAPCPACGHRDKRTIACVMVEGEQIPMIRSECGVCSARWHQSTIVKATQGEIWPASFPGGKR